MCFNFQAIIDDIKDNKQQKDIITDIKELSEKYIIPEHEVIGIVSIPSHLQVFNHDWLFFRV